MFDALHETFVNVTKERISVLSVDFELHVLQFNIYSSQCYALAAFDDVRCIFAYYNENFAY